MEIKNVSYTGSYPNIKACPIAEKPEYAFIGRSNVGKSSLINMLSGRKDLARVSKEPGKTQMINFFLVDESWILVDLPGYGYAKVSKSQRKKFGSMIKGYLKHRETLQCVFQLIDIRIAPQKNDLDFINWMGSEGIPFVLVFTKADRFSKSEIDEKVKAFEDKMLEEWTEMPKVFITSSAKHKGREKLLDFIDSINAHFHDLGISS